MGRYLNFDFLNINHENLVPQQGRILISEPLLSDAYFKRSVILITEHSDQGAVGFVLNKPIEIPLNVAKDTVHFLHTLGNLVTDSVHVIDNIYWGGDFDVLKELIGEGMVKKDQVRFFLGYSGWSPNQLEDEIAENAWIVAEVDPKKLMFEDKNIWKKTLENLGKKYKIWSNFPENPAMN